RRHLHRGLEVARARDGHAGKAGTGGVGHLARDVENVEVVDVVRLRAPGDSGVHGVADVEGEVLNARVESAPRNRDGDALGGDAYDEHQCALLQQVSVRRGCRAVTGHVVDLDGELLWRAEVDREVHDR